MPPARPTARLSIEPSIEFNWITLPKRKLNDEVTLDKTEFDANAFGGRVSYSFSTTLFTKLFAQWSTDTDMYSPPTFCLIISTVPVVTSILSFNQNYTIPVIVV